MRRNQASCTLVENKRLARPLFISEGLHFCYNKCMRSLFRITLVLLVLGLGVFFSYSIYDQYLREKKPVEESGPDIRGEFNVFAGRNAIEVDDQQTIGTTVTVRAISIVDRGFVVILPSERYLLS